MIGGDNLFEDTLSELMVSFEKKGSTIGLYDVNDLELVKKFNNLTLNEDKRIIEFIEKPDSPTSTLHATLIYMLKKEAYPYIEEVIQKGQADRAGDLIAFLCKKIPVYGQKIEGKWFDIGSFEQLQEAEKWIDLKKQK